MHSQECSEHKHEPRFSKLTLLVIKSQFSVTAVENSCIFFHFSLNLEGFFLKLLNFGCFLSRSSECIYSIISILLSQPPPWCTQTFSVVFFLSYILVVPYSTSLCSKVQTLPASKPLKLLSLLETHSWSCPVLVIFTENLHLKSSEYHILLNKAPSYKTFPADHLTLAPVFCFAFTDFPSSSSSPQS